MYRGTNNLIFVSSRNGTVMPEKLHFLFLTGIKLVPLYFTRNYTGIMFEFDLFAFSKNPVLITGTTAPA